MQMPNSLIMTLSKNTYINVVESKEKSVCFSTPDVDVNISNDQEFGAKKSPTETQIQMAVSGKVKSAFIDALKSGGKGGKLHQNDDTEQNSLIAGSSDEVKPQLLDINYQSNNSSDEQNSNQSLQFQTNNNIMTGVKLSSTADGDLKGLAASKCVVPNEDFWFIGGQTHVSDTTELVLANPNSSASEVKITLWGNDTSQGMSDDGSLKFIGNRDIGVNAKDETHVLLSGGAPNQDVIAVHVEAKYSPISAVIFSRTLKGLLPQGLDYINSTALPGHQQMITGIGVNKSENQTGYLNLLSFDQNTTVDVEFIQNSSPESSNSSSHKNITHKFSLNANKISLIDLNFLENGVWTAYLNSDSNIIASIRLEKQISDGTGEFTYLSAQSPQNSLLLPLSDFNSIKVSLASFSQEQKSVYYAVYNQNGKYIMSKSLNIAKNKPIELNRSDLGAQTDFGYYILFKSKDDANVIAQTVINHNSYLSNISSDSQNVKSMNYQLKKVTIQ